jgi:hypothetical protein
VEKYDKWFNSELHKPGSQGAERRQDIFNRIREPVKKNDPETFPTYAQPLKTAEKGNRGKQSLMPQLGGDDGQSFDISQLMMLIMHIVVGNTTGNNYMSLTKLQYDRLQKWSTNEFVSGELKSPPKSFEDIPIHDQPDALCRAALEWSIGAALYPGIECYWVVQFDEMYSKRAFRFNRDKVKPGHLTRGLSYPWQSDFYMCESKWQVRTRFGVPSVWLTATSSSGGPLLGLTMLLSNETICITRMAIFHALLGRAVFNLQVRCRGFLYISVLTFW